MNNFKSHRLLIGFIISILIFGTFISCTVEDPIKQYKIVFHSNGGSEIKDLIMISGKPIISPENPIKKDSVFDGWFMDVEKTQPFVFGVTYYTTLGFDLYAKWAKACNVTFVTDGGTEIPSIIVNSGKYVTKPKDPVKSGYLFGGWYADSNFTTLFNFSIPASIDVSIYAKWDIIRFYSVTFNSNGGTTPNTQSIKSGDSASKPTTSNQGKTLVGWYLDASFTTPFDFINTPVVSDINLYANWATSSPASDFAFDAASGKITSYKGNATDVVIPESIGGAPVTILGYGLFMGKQISSIVLPSSIIAFESKTESGFETVSRTFQDCKVKNINLFNTAITTIPKWSFMFGVIENIILPGTLEQIQQGAFEGSSLKSITVPNSVKYIEPYSFFRCKSLTKVSLGKGVLSIGNGVYAESSILAELTLSRDILPVTTIGADNPFRDVSSSLSIKVPMALVSDYKSAWPIVASKIVGY